MIEGRMTVERVSHMGGYWGAELHVGGRWFASVNNRHTEETLMRDANAVANRWNACDDALAQVTGPNAQSDKSGNLRYALSDSATILRRAIQEED